MKVYPPRDIRSFVMYCVNGKPRSSLLIESTDSMIYKEDFAQQYDKCGARSGSPQLYRTHISTGLGALHCGTGNTSPGTQLNMNNHIYSTLYKRLERKSDRRSKETEQRKNHKTHTHTNIYIYIYIILYIY